MSPTRIGNFTSSEIVALLSMGVRDMTPAELLARPKEGTGSRTKTKDDVTTFGKAALTYIHECNMERRLGRSIEREQEVRNFSWGKLNERRVHDIIGMDYKLCSADTLGHPTIPYWKGSPDFIHCYEDSKMNAVVDSKCPITMKSFCQLVDPYYIGGLTGMDFINALRFGWEDKKTGYFHEKHSEGEKYYYQLVSNSCITLTGFAELIVYMPFQKELEKIKALADGDPQHYWIRFAERDEQLPYLVNDGFYKNINVFRFEVPFLDKQLLTKRVELAGKKLIEVKPIPVEI
jgi:hypothetical protein